MNKNKKQTYAYVNTAFSQVKRRIEMLNLMINRERPSVEWRNFLNAVSIKSKCLVDGDLSLACRMSKILSATKLPELKITKRKICRPAGAVGRLPSMESIKGALKSATGCLDFIFSYDALPSSAVDSIAEWFGCSVCPYCEENSVVKIQTPLGDSVLRSDIDHWFHAAANPALQLNIHNLIPTCKICNGIKLAKPFAIHRNFRPTPSSGSLPGHIYFNIIPPRKSQKSSDKGWGICLTMRRRPRDALSPKAVVTGNLLQLLNRYTRHQSAIRDMLRKALNVATLPATPRTSIGKFNARTNIIQEMLLSDNGHVERTRLMRSLEADLVHQMTRLAR